MLNSRKLDPRRTGAALLYALRGDIRAEASRLHLQGVDQVYIRLLTARCRPIRSSPTAKIRTNIAG